MTYWIVMAAGLIGASGVATTSPAHAADDFPRAVDVAAKALEPTTAAPAIRRIDSGRAVAGPDNNCDPAGICLSVTLSTDLDPTHCGDHTTLDAAVGDQVNFCYTLTNNSDTPFDYQTASDNVGRAERQFFIAFKHTVEPHATYQFNRIETMRETEQAITTWTATAAGAGYSFDDSVPFDFIDITGDGTNLHVGEVGQTAVEMPFPVNLYGIPSRYLAVGHGAVGFGSRHDPFVTSWGWTLPVPCGTALYAVCPMIVPLGMGFNGLVGGGVYSETFGAAPNRRFVVEWYDVPTLVPPEYLTTPGGATYEIVFDEGSDEVLFQYLDTHFDDPDYTDADDGGIAEIGLNFGGPPGETVASIYSQSTPSLHDGAAIRWTPTAVATSRATAHAMVTVYAPAINVDTDAIEATAAPGGNAQSTFHLTDIGAGNLRWDIGPPSSAAHLPTGPHYDGPVGAAAVLPSSAIETLERARAEENLRLVAAGNARRYPEALRHGAMNRSASPLDASGIPTYTWLETFDPFEDFVDKLQLARFDLLAPQTVTPVSDLFTSQHISYDAIFPDFIGDDFTTAYALNGPDLMAFDTTSGTGVSIGQFDIDGQTTVSSFNYSPLDGLFYAYICTENRFNCRLDSLDPSGWALAQGPSLSSLSGALVSATITATGEMYAVTLVPGGRLVAIDRLTGETSIIGDMHVFADTTTLNGWYLDVDDRDGGLYLTAIDTSTLESVAFAVDSATGLTQEIGRRPLSDGTAFVGTLGMAIATSRPFGPCTDLSQTPWLSVDPASGVIGGGGTIDVNVAFDASTLAEGVYTANLCVNSNDPDRRHIVIPTTLTVGAGDAVFRDGFD